MLPTPSSSNLDFTTVLPLSLSPSPNYTSNSMPSETHSTKFHTLGKNPTTRAKVGSILGLAIFLLFFLVLCIFIFIRHRRCPRLTSSGMPPTDSEVNGLSDTQSTLLSQSSTAEIHTGQSSIVGRDEGRVGCRNAVAEIVVIETEAKNSMDSEGNRWPDEVVLMGEAQEIREWSMGYGLGDRNKGRKSLRAKREKEREGSLSYGVEML
jgi:hypothetical protein